MARQQPISASYFQEWLDQRGHRRLENRVKDICTHLWNQEKESRCQEEDRSIKALLVTALVLAIISMTGAIALLFGVCANG